MIREYGLMADLEAAFDDVVNVTRTLIAELDNKDYPIWSLEKRESADKAWLAAALNDFWYEEGQDGRSTRAYVGVVAADRTLLILVENVNQAKRRFSECLALIKQQNSAGVPDIKGALASRHAEVHGYLADKGLARLNLKQCWRQIPCAAAPLERIHLSWYSSGRSITRITAAEAADRLYKMDTEAPHIALQIRSLAGIPSSEVLARVQKQAPLMRANLFFQEPLWDGAMRKAMNLSLPLFVPSHDGALPRINQPELTAPAKRTRKVRSDERLEDEPFLPALRVYRYRE